MKIPKIIYTVHVFISKDKLKTLTVKYYQLLTVNNVNRVQCSPIPMNADMTIQIELYFFLVMSSLRSL